MSVLPLCINMYHVYTMCIWRLEEGIRSPGTDSGTEVVVSLCVGAMN